MKLLCYFGRSWCCCRRCCFCCFLSLAKCFLVFRQRQRQTKPVCLFTCLCVHCCQPIHTEGRAHAVTLCVRCFKRLPTKILLCDWLDLNRILNYSFASLNIEKSAKWVCSWDVFSTHVLPQQQQKHNIDLAHERTSNDRFFVLLRFIDVVVVARHCSYVMMAIKSNYKFLMHRQATF